MIFWHSHNSFSHRSNTLLRQRAEHSKAKIRQNSSDDLPVEVDLTTANVDYLESIGLIEKPAVKSSEAVTPFTDDQQNLPHAKNNLKAPFEMISEKQEQPIFKSSSSNTFLDIEQDELSEVINARKQSNAAPNPSFRFNQTNPLMWIGNITQSVIEDVVMKVCEELVSVDNVLAANILDIELLRWKYTKLSASGLDGDFKSLRRPLKGRLWAV